MIFTDRSRYLKGLERCPRERYLEYHAFGTGFRPKGQDIFLATGLAIHAGMEGLLKAVQGGVDVDRIAARGIIVPLIAQYKEQALATGLLGALPDDYKDQMSFVIEEQACLVEGLYWCFYRALLPWLLEEFEIVAIEQEEWKIAGCTCGLGKGLTGAADLGEIADHEAAGCDGVVIMSRPDFVAQRRRDQSLVIFDFKSTGYTLDTREHEHIVQMVFGSLGVERRLGRPCTSHYFIGLHKGKREADRGQTVKRQKSALCYGYLRPSAGMLDPGDWRSSYEWEEGGKTRRVTKDYIRTPVWEAHFSEKAEGMSNVEHLVFSQPAEFAAGQCSYLGPSQRPEWMVAKILRQVAAHEREWVDRLRVVSGNLENLDEAVPCSWDCYPYGRACSYQDICFEGPGWQAPLEHEGRWEKRVPHHTTEPGGGER